MKYLKLVLVSSWSEEPISRVYLIWKRLSQKRSAASEPIFLNGAPLDLSRGGLSICGGGGSRDRQEARLGNHLTFSGQPSYYVQN